jgi:hypothetical protein
MRTRPGASGRMATRRPSAVNDALGRYGRAFIATFVQRADTGSWLERQGLCTLREGRTKMQAAA